MIYQLIGAPDTGKGEVTERLRVYLNGGATATEFFIVPPDIQHDYFDLSGMTFGFLTDYRQELLLASHRATQVVDCNVIQTHSLLDSVAYTGLHVKDLLEEDQSNPDVIRWGTVFNTSLQMLIDSKQPDHIFYLPYEGDDDNCRNLDEAIQDVLDTLDIPFIEINASEEAATWVSN